MAGYFRKNELLEPYRNGVITRTKILRQRKRPYNKSQIQNPRKIYRKA